MKMKKPKKMIEAKQGDIVLICTMGKSSVFVTRRMKNGKYEAKINLDSNEEKRTFNSIDEALSVVQKMVKVHETILRIKAENQENDKPKSEEEKKV